MSTTITPVEPTEPAPVPGGRRWPRRFVRPGAAALSGLLLFASFPPRPLWWLALPGFALLGWTLRGRRPRAGFGLGFLAGLGFLLPLLKWTGEEVGPLPWVALAAVSALFIGAVGTGISVVSRLPAWPVFAAAVWILGEAARARVPFGGFPWGKIAFGQADGMFLPLAAVGGTPVLGFAVVLCGFGLYEAVRLLLARRAATAAPDPAPSTDPEPARRDGAAPRPVPRAAVAVAALSVLVPVVGALAALPLVDDSAEDGTATVAAIQGNVPRLGLDFNAQRRQVLDNHAARTEQLAADVKAGKEPKPDFVLWPENSSDLDPYRNGDARLVIDDAVKAIGVPTVIGSVLSPDTGTLRNSLIKWDPEEGPVAEYDKRHVQPFGEYIPMRSFVRIFSSDVDRVRRDFGPGDKVGVFDLAGTKVGLATCYEAAFDWAVRDTVTHGAQLITVPSNNATFGRSEMTYQQLAMSRVRAVEHSRAVVVPVTSGVSAMIMPDGEVVDQSKMFTPDALVREMPLRSSRTPATTMGTLPEALLVAVAAGGLGWVGARTVRARRRPASDGMS
ncbi:apolipoprotein N-acyltransferase [Streptomyces sp. NP-1717]|uniref:apolipoprotein N-acyltransferase n=1 Tax=Streptomyces sp. NP-1717 TaxID=2704470 RepID=UPI001F5D4490|nr:apolipoprotein N-acyltransferase [Streptomyces sp. NP-1717]MCI3226426.1 apolipoprotein N-acyltransferase [Streptomyces sp. NP-1717]